MRPSFCHEYTLQGEGDRMTETGGMATPYTETQRMVLRSHVNLAGEVIAKMWPMRTVIAPIPYRD